MQNSEAFSPRCSALFRMDHMKKKQIVYFSHKTRHGVQPMLSRLAVTAPGPEVFVSHKHTHHVLIA